MGRAASHGGEQIGRIAVIEFAALGFAIRRGSDDEQAQALQGRRI
jgi:hypothetical protein